MEVDPYGVEKGNIRHTPTYDANSFSRSFPQGGAFWVFRRNLIDQIGGFDEQFRVGPDMEYSHRIAVNRLPMARAPGCLGYFTNEGKGLSTSASSRLAAIERTAIQLRYALYDKINLEYYQLAQEFHADEFMMEGKWLPLEKVWPGRDVYRMGRQWLWHLGKARYLFREFLQRLRLLEILHKLQKLFTSKEI
jgi:hypothetical protein